MFIDLTYYICLFLHIQILVGRSLYIDLPKYKLGEAHLRGMFATK